MIKTKKTKKPWPLSGRCFSIGYFFQLNMKEKTNIFSNVI